MRQFVKSLVVASAVVLSACSYSKGGTVSPSGIVAPGADVAVPGGIQPQALTALLGTWSGSTTSTDGHSSNGSLSVVFTAGLQVSNGNGNGTTSNCHGNDDNHGDAHPNSNTCDPQDIVAAVTWTSGKTSLTFHGTATGPLSNVSINGTDNACHYSANGALNSPGTTISGSYAFSGAGCKHDSGNFSISK